MTRDVLAPPHSGNGVCISTENVINQPEVDAGRTRDAKKMNKAICQYLVHVKGNAARPSKVAMTAPQPP